MSSVHVKWAPLIIQVASIRCEHPYAAKEDLSTALHLPDLEAFEFSRLERTETPEVSEDTSHTEERAPSRLEDEDIWESISVLEPVQRAIDFHTWEGFEARNSKPADGSAYLSEAGPHAFMSALSSDEVLDTGQGREYFDSPTLLRSLFAIGLGRESLLFEYDKGRRNFNQRVESNRLFGTSALVSQKFLSEFLEIGRTFRSLKGFAESAYLSKVIFPAKVALANATASVLSTLERELESKSVKSFLQLKELFQEPHSIVHHLKELVDNVRRTTSDEKLMTGLFKFLQTREHLPPNLQNLNRLIMSQVSSPWLELVEEWTGLREVDVSSFNRSRSFVTTFEDSQKEDQEESSEEFTYNHSLMPPFIPEEDGQVLFETGINLRFLRKHHPDHVISNPSKYGVVTPKIQWLFDWESIERVTERAKEYERELRSAVNRAKTLPISASRVVTSRVETVQETRKIIDLDDPEGYILDLERLLDEEPTNARAEFDDSISSLIANAINDNRHSASGGLSVFMPPISVTPFLSFNPILATQARLVNGTALRKLFRSHKLRLHLDLQRDYHLLGDGVFVSNLSSALFNPNLETTERRSGVARSGQMMGLKLGTRSTWPPASSELRLALMGILSHCYQSSPLYARFGDSIETRRPSAGYREQDDLPGQMSFGIRNLSEAEIEKLMDPQTIHALDFLRLQYNPSSPLDLVLTSAILDKYDRLFKFLLRLLRLLYVVSHLPRRNLNAVETRFRMEANFFVNCLSNYFFETGIKNTWNSFSKFLDTLERQLQTEDRQGEVGTIVNHGLESVKARHEDCLNQILSTLFLRKRHERVMALLEELFNLVLQFAASLHGGEKGSDDANAAALYKEFAGKVKIFRDVCRGMAMKETRESSAVIQRDDILARLLRSFLDWSL